MEVLLSIFPTEITVIIQTFIQQPFFEIPNTLLFALPNNALNTSNVRCYGPHAMIRFRLQEWLNYRIAPLTKEKFYDEPWYTPNWREALFITSLTREWSRHDLTAILDVCSETLKA